jgi:nicotinamidase-related amidase
MNRRELLGVVGAMGAGMTLGGAHVFAGGHGKTDDNKMRAKTYDPADTALLVVDPYNDFMSEGGKLYDQIKDVADSVDMFGNLRKLIPAARSAGLKIFVLPHRRYQKGDYENWRQRTAPQVMAMKNKVFERGTWGGEFHPEFGPQKGDVVVHEHWAQSSFANTDLDFQLKQHGIRKIILVGMVANTCIESTGRFGMELGYHVTLVKDATAAFSREAMQAALEVNWPTFAHSILTTAPLLAEIG